MDVIRSPLVHGVSILTDDGEPVVVLAGPREEISDDQIAERAKALLHRRHWLEVHYKLFGGIPPRAVLTAVLAVLVAVVVVTAAVMGMIWTLHRRPAQPLIDDGHPPAAAGQLAPSTSAPGELVASGDGQDGQHAKAGASAAPSGSVPPTTVSSTGQAGTTGPAGPLGPVRAVVGSHPIRSIVGKHPVRSVAGTNPVRGAVSTVSSIVDDAGHTASSVVCTVLCPPTTTAP